MAIYITLCRFNTFASHNIYVALSLILQDITITYFVPVVIVIWPIGWSLEYSF